MTENQLAVHHLNHLAAFRSSACASSSSAVLLHYPPFSCTSFLPWALLMHTDAAGEVSISSPPRWPSAEGSACWRGLSQVKQGCTGDRNWRYGSAASFVGCSWQLASCAAAVTWGGLGCTSHSRELSPCTDPHHSTLPQVVLSKGACLIKLHLVQMCNI